MFSDFVVFKIKVVEFREEVLKILFVIEVLFIDEIVIVEEIVNFRDGFKILKIFVVVNLCYREVRDKV